MFSCTAALFLLFSLLAGTPVFAGPAALPSDSEEAEILAEVAEATAKVKTLASTFVQEKHLSMFKEVLISRGRLFFQRPDKLRWELLTPVSSGFSVNGGQARRWHAMTGETQTLQVANDPALSFIARQMISWAAIDLTAIRKDYDLSVAGKDPLSLRLTPISPEFKKYLDAVIITLAGDKRYVTSVEARETDGDFTKIVFSNTSVNEPMDAELF